VEGFFTVPVPPLEPLTLVLVPGWTVEDGLAVEGETVALEPFLTTTEILLTLVLPAAS
jgi:hypothetical protein